MQVRVCVVVFASCEIKDRRGFNVYGRPTQKVLESSPGWIFPCPVHTTTIGGSWTLESSSKSYPIFPNQTLFKSFRCHHPDQLKSKDCNTTMSHCHYCLWTSVWPWTGQSLHRCHHTGPVEADSATRRGLDWHLYFLQTMASAAVRATQRGRRDNVTQSFVSALSDK